MAAQAQTARRFGLLTTSQSNAKTPSQASSEGRNLLQVYSGSTDAELHRMTEEGRGLSGQESSRLVLGARDTALGLCEWLVLSIEKIL